MEDVRKFKRICNPSKKESATIRSVRSTDSNVENIGSPMSVESDEIDGVDLYADLSAETDDDLSADDDLYDDLSADDDLSATIRSVRSDDSDVEKSDESDS